VDVWPHLVSREFLATLLVTAILLVWSLMMNAPLEAEANLNVTPNPSKAPWYFVGLQELLVYFDPWIAGVVLPTVIIIGLVAIPYVDTNPKGVGYWAKMKWKRLGPLPIWYPEERPFAVSVFMLGVIMWFVLIFIGTYCRGPNWEWYSPWEVWSHRRIAKMTLKNIPNLWGVLVMGSYFLLGTPFPKPVKDALAAKGGPKAPTLASAALHMGLGLLMAVAIFVPLLTAPDADYPLRSRFTTLFEALGQSRNAPMVSMMYGLVHSWGAAGYAAVAGIVLAAGAFLGLLGMAFGTLKDRMYEELGPIKYAIVIGLFLMMMGVLGKIVLRLLFGIKYLISIPTFNFNI